MKAVKKITKILPFVAIIALNVFAQAGGFRLELLKPFALIIAAVLVINLTIALFLKVKDYFAFGLTGVALIGIISIFIFPLLGQLYAENVIVGLYLGLFIVAAFPPLFKIKPFTFQFSENDYPEAVTGGEQFLRINLIINYIWVVLFALGIVLTLVPYHSDDAINTIIATLVPIVLQLAIGIPLTVKLPAYLMQKVGGGQMIFKSIKDMFSAMPFGLNKTNAKGISTVIQFFLTGDEPTIGYFIIDDQKCTYNEGEHPNPKTTIKCDSKLWLQISNKEVSGGKALINNEYQVEGDATIMLKFADLFAAPKAQKKKKTVKSKQAKFEYKTFAPNKIKNIVVFDGGFRSIKFSKTTFMVNHFIDGAKQAGANVEYFKLKNYDIKDCSGCYTCWTKTPGECIFKDDMTMLRKKYREADLVVFASPLYIFNVTGIMKTFMDRLLPVLEPYMLMNENGDTMHPDRFPEKGEQGFVVFSAAGFPDVDHNFDGLTGMYRCWDSHNENTHLMGEFFLTAAEIIVQPVYAERRNMIKDVCIKAGKQIVEQGKI
ncbi:MAG: hypothetical protein DRI95_10995, partial [Bacteroidetes bacterium]